jgi:hypothetical protein
MAKDPIEQFVYLFPQRDSHGVVSWTWMYKGEIGSAASFPTIQANHGQNDISFTVFDPTSAIKFAGYQNFNVSEALWLSPKGSPTAKHPGILTDNQFDGVSLLQNGIQLKLADANGKNADFVYQLNFVDSQNNNAVVTAIDPEIKNGDGAVKFYQSAAALLIVGAVAGALVSVLFVRLALRWRAA